MSYYDVKSINSNIALSKREANIDTNLISDTFHTFGDLYEHRVWLWIKLCSLEKLNKAFVWRSLKHSDGSNIDGWFLLGIGQIFGEQITYHVPMRMWEYCFFAPILELAPTFDGHTSSDVLERLKNL
jgi:hypothetical protein